MDAKGAQGDSAEVERAPAETAVNDVEQLTATAIAARTAGRFDEAAALFTGLMEREPDNPNHRYLIGKVEHARGNYERAIDHLSKANDLFSQSADIHVSLGMALVELNRFVEASDWFQSALQLDPEFPPALNNLGLLLLRAEHFDEAALCFEQILERDANIPTALVNLGRARTGQRRPLESITLFQRALEYDSGNINAYELLGVSQRDLGLHADAEATFRVGLRCDPKNANVRYNLTYALIDQNRFADAFEVANQNLAINPDSALAHMALGHLYRVQDKPKKGLSHLLRAIELDPDNLSLRMNYGKVLESIWKPEEALAAYVDVVVRDPRFDDALARCIDAMVSLGRWDRYDKLLSTLINVIAEATANDEPPKVLAFNLQALPISYEMIAQSAHQASLSVVRTESLNESRFDFGSRAPRSKLRVGYLLPYTWWHSLPMVLKPIIEAHRRDGIELHGYCVTAHNDTNFSADYRAAFDRFSDLSRLPARQAAERVNQDGIDVLIDVSGHTNISCLPVLAHRPAPVQAHYLGYSITTGADFVDYSITDREFMPPELAMHNCEKAVYLPGSFMIAPRSAQLSEVPSRAELSLPDDAFVIANFNHPCKFEPEIFATWMRILNRIPRAVLWCGAWIDATKRNLRAAAERQGVAAGRLIFSKQIDRDKHCARLALADLALDTYYHGGGITSVDALSAGVPLLSVRGQTPSSRMGATILSAAGMRELICADLQEYEQRAAYLAGAPHELNAIRGRLSDALESSPLFDLDRYTRNLERAYHLMWGTYLDGKGPIEISVPNDAVLKQHRRAP